MNFSLTDDSITLTYHLEKIGKDLLISILGGASHIGSVTTIFDGNITTEVAQNHKDDALTEPLAKALMPIYPYRMVILGGFHLDSLTKEGIEKVLQLHQEGIKKVTTYVKDL